MTATLTLKVLNEKIPARVTIAVEQAIAQAAEQTDAKEALAYVAARLAQMTDRMRGFAIVWSASERTLGICRAPSPERHGPTVLTISRDATPAELAEELEQIRAEVIRGLNRMVERGAEARQVVAAKIAAKDLTGELAYVVEWGNGVHADLLAVHAAFVLNEISPRRGIDLERALAALANELERRLLQNHYTPNSTSLFSNAVTVEAARVAREMAKFCRTRLGWIADARAKIEAL